MLRLLTKTPLKKPTELVDYLLVGFDSLFRSFKISIYVEMEIYLRVAGFESL